MPLGEEYVVFLHDGREKEPFYVFVTSYDLHAFGLPFFSVNNYFQIGKHLGRPT